MRHTLEACVSWSRSIDCQIRQDHSPRKHHLNTCHRRGAVFHLLHSDEIWVVCHPRISRLKHDIMNHHESSWIIMNHHELNKQSVCLKSWPKQWDFQIRIEWRLNAKTIGFSTSVCSPQPLETILPSMVLSGTFHRGDSSVSWSQTRTPHTDELRN